MKSFDIKSSFNVYLLLQIFLYSSAVLASPLQAPPPITCFTGQIPPQYVDKCCIAGQNVFAGCNPSYCGNNFPTSSTFCQQSCYLRPTLACCTLYQSTTGGACAPILASQCDQNPNINCCAKYPKQPNCLKPNKSTLIHAYCSYTKPTYQNGTSVPAGKVGYIYCRRGAQYTIVKDNYGYTNSTYTLNLNNSWNNQATTHTSCSNPDYGYGATYYASSSTSVQVYWDSQDGISLSGINSANSTLDQTVEVTGPNVPAGVVTTDPAQLTAAQLSAVCPTFTQANLPGLGSTVWAASSYQALIANDLPDVASLALGSG